MWPSTNVGNFKHRDYSEHLNKELLNKVWLSAFNRQRILQEAKQRFEAGFNHQEWQKRFVGYLKQKGDTVMFDHFREFDLKDTGFVTGSDFKKAIVKTGFPTSEANLDHIVEILGQSEDNTIGMWQKIWQTTPVLQLDYYKFIQGIASNTNVSLGSGSDEMVLQDKIVSEVARCTCVNRLLLQKTGDHEYKVSAITIQGNMGGFQEIIGPFFQKSQKMSDFQTRFLSIEKLRFRPPKSTKT